MPSHVIPVVGRSLEIVKRAYANRREGCPFLFHSIKCGRWTKRHHPGEPCLGRLQALRHPAGVRGARRHGEGRAPRPPTSVPTPC